VPQGKRVADTGGWEVQVEPNAPNEIAGIPPRWILDDIDITHSVLSTCRAKCRRGVVGDLHGVWLSDIFSFTSNRHSEKMLMNCFQILNFFRIAITESHHHHSEHCKRDEFAK
jgi:hypothetical protein